MMKEKECFLKEENAMSNNEFQKISVTYKDDHTKEIWIGNCKLLEIEIDTADEKKVVHKPKRGSTVCGDACELSKALNMAIQ